ncbi:uncharacterized protein LOC102357270 [Latimeria chalumnae]|uniref:uncharacterized protein LOC102357270 n=1 Tax=Latimeria chalumnae TaxID=7897 RepID=UPI0003C1531F|nr:PREDICTED: uncharacterized protein LOC102357270 [Latimeria chalumnae]|eukprot:XP_006001674.1 PREDICTED: uncharacterized protein LOC102357270 [Latimeria chalumnae]
MLVQELTQDGDTMKTFQHKYNLKRLLCCVIVSIAAVMGTAVAILIVAEECWNCQRRFESQVGSFNTERANLELARKTLRSELEDCYRKAMQSLSAKEDLIAELRTALLSRQEKQTFAETNVTMLKDEVLMLQNQTSQLSVENKALQDEVTNWKRKFADVSQQLDGYKQRYTEAAEQWKKAENARQQCENNKKDLDQMRQNHMYENFKLHQLWSRSSGCRSNPSWIVMWMTTVLLIFSHFVK